MRAIDLCAGAGGLSLGLARAGFDVLGVERDRSAALWHRAHVGPCDLADVATWHPPGPVELVAGGVPCQAFSTQGKRRGLTETIGPLFGETLEPRAQLYRHLIRIAVEAKASAVLLDLPAPTISAGAGGRLARAGHKEAGDQWKGAVRLTASQCAILQGFPPEWSTAWDRLSSTDAHRLIGNAVPPALGEAVGETVRDALLLSLRLCEACQSAPADGPDGICSRCAEFLACPIHP